MARDRASHTKEEAMDTTTGAPRTLGAVAKRIRRGPTAVVLAASLLIAATYGWQHAALNQQRVAMEQVASSGAASRTQVSELQGELATLQGRIDGLTSNANALKARIRSAGHDTKHLTGALRSTQQRLREAQAQITAFIGAPLADGRYFGQVVAVGASQAPLRLVIDLEQWLTGDAAQQAEEEYGVPADARYDNFIENDSPAWHTIEVASSVEVTILGTNGHFQQVGTGLVGTQPVSLGRFAKMFSLGRVYNPFWITVSGGKITQIQEEYME
jgi:hypothetical protein